MLSPAASGTFAARFRMSNGRTMARTGRIMALKSEHERVADAISFDRDTLVPWYRESSEAIYKKSRKISVIFRIFLAFFVTLFS